MDIKFHCGIEGNFPHSWQRVRSFLYRSYQIEPHTHDFYEINIVMKGSGIHHIENARFDVKAGDVFVIPPLTVHAYSDTRELDVHHILLHRRFVEQNKKEAENKLAELALKKIGKIFKNTN